MVSNRKLLRYAVDSFVTILEQISGKCCRYRLNKVDEISFYKFLNVFDGVGEEFIRMFLEYQFQSWFNKGTDIDYSHTIRLSWMFGEKAVKRWKANKIETNVYLTRNHIQKFHDIKIKRTNKELQTVVVAVRIVEENFKKEFLNTKRGFSWCIANTTLFNHKSSNCIICQSKAKCKKMLENQYNNIYKLRGYAEQQIG